MKASLVPFVFCTDVKKTLKRIPSTTLAVVAMITVISLTSTTGCKSKKEIEYPPEVIPDIPPGDRNSDGLEPPN